MAFIQNGVRSCIRYSATVQIQGYILIRRDDEVVGRNAVRQHDIDRSCCIAHNGLQFVSRCN